MANTIYIATTGNDSTGTGSFSAPWRTFSAGLARMSAGDSLVVRGGTYAEHVSVSNRGTDWTIGSGAIYVAAYQGETVWIQSPAAGNALIFNTGVGVAYHIWERIGVDGINLNDNTGGATYIGHDCHHIRLNNCENKNAYWSGVHCFQGPYIEILNCQIHDGGRVAGGGAAAHGIYQTDFVGQVVGAHQHCTFSGNHIWNFTFTNDSGIQLFATGTNALGGAIVEHNIIHHCAVGMFICDCLTVPTTVRYNRIYDITYAAGISLYTAANADIYNNTIDGGVGYGISIGEGTFCRGTIRNNAITNNALAPIFVSNASGSSFVSFDYNGINSNGHGNTIQDLNSLSVDGGHNSTAAPGYTNRSGGDYTLTAGSAYRDVGVFITNTSDITGVFVPQNSIPDIGCHEYPVGDGSTSGGGSGGSGLGGSTSGDAGSTVTSNPPAAQQTGPVYESSGGKQNFAGANSTSLSSDAFALTAGRLLVVVLRAFNAGTGADVSISDTAGNTFTYDGSAGVGHGLGFAVWSCNNCKGNASNVVTVTYPNQPFVAMTWLQFSGTPSAIVCDFSTNVVASGATVTLAPNSAYATQIAVVASDLGNTGLPTITGAPLTAIYSSGPSGNGPFVGVGSHRVEYNVNRSKLFDGTVTLTATYANTTNDKSIFAAIYRQAPPPVFTPTFTPPVAAETLTFEDPCTIEDPRYHSKITTETETLRYSTHPLRNDPASGGYHEPRVLDWSDIVRTASDPTTGAWQAQSMTVRHADTDRRNRGISGARFGLRGCDYEFYITSKSQAAQNGPPRLLMAGKINNDPKAENLVFEVVINDLIGSDYTILGEEKQIPQRTVDPNWFPGASKDVRGLGEPIVYGRRSPLDPANGEGVHKCRTVGRVAIGTSAGTPTATTLATIVGLLNTAGAAGTIYATYGSKIGYSDATTLQSYYDSNGGVPSSYDGLASIIGYGDLDAWLAGTAATGGNTYVAALVASGATLGLINGSNGQPSIWIDALQLDPAQRGTQWWYPGDATWTSTFGSNKYTDLVGADGRTRRYTLALFATGTTYGNLVENGGSVHVDCEGFDSVGDATGTLLEDAFDCYQHLLRNFLIQNYQSGVWLTGPTFLFSDGITVIDRIQGDSFDTAKAVAQLQIAQGRLWSFAISDRTSVRTIVQKANVSCGAQLAVDDYQRLFIRTLDFRRTNFYTNVFGSVHRTLKHKSDIWGFWLEPKPDWQVNRLYYQYAKNDNTGSFERGSGGGGTDLKIEDLTRQGYDGVIPKTLVLDYVKDDLTGVTIAGNYLQLFAKLPHVAHYKRRGFCGLEDDVLDGLPITHYNGYGDSGWIDHAAWIQSKVVKKYHTEYTALDVEPLMSAIENPQPTALSLDPVALRILVADDNPSNILIPDA